MTPPIGAARAGSIGSGWTAIPDSGVVDNFEQDPDGPYASGEDLSTYYAGDLSTFSRGTSTTLEGSRTLVASNHGQWFYIASTEGDGLPRYPRKGDRFSVLMRPGSDSFPQVQFATPSSHSENDLGYGVRLATNNEIILRKEMTGGGNLDSTTAGISGGSVYEVVAEWHDGTGSETDNTIVATVYNFDVQNQTRGTEVGSVSATDSDLASNVGIAFTEAGGNNPNNRWDRYKVLGSVS